VVSEKWNLVGLRLNPSAIVETVIVVASRWNVVSL